MVDIYDWNDLDAVRNDLTASYTLQNDLDKDTAGYSGIGDDWTPLGFVSDNAEGNPFSGALNGQGYQISDLVIEENNSAEGGVAFITNVSDGGVVKNLGVNGTVDSTISHFQFAGLAGYVGSSGTGDIQNCASHIDVAAPNGENVGGLAGYNDGTITNSYATGAVDGEKDVGGLVGFGGGSFETSYAVGSVTATTDAGGLLGHDSGTATVVDCYWDTQTTGQSASEGSATGLTTSEMQGDEASTNMGGFDFTAVWDEVIADGSVGGTVPASDGYPILQALNPANQLDSQGVAFSVANGIYVDGTEYDCLVDGTQYDVVQN